MENVFQFRMGHFGSLGGGYRADRFGVEPLEESPYSPPTERRRSQKDMRLVEIVRLQRLGRSRAKEQTEG